MFGLAFALSILAFSTAPLRAEIGTYILIDAKTGSVLAEQDATRKWYPASLTKMMTAYVTFKAIRDGKASLNSVVVQSANSIKEPPSKMGFKVGTQFTVETALKIILIKSANDIAVALGEAIGGSEPAFIDMMNAEARRLGMQDTVFVNPNGLPDNRQITTARDMAILAQALRRDFPQAQNYYNHPGIKFGKKTLRSANREFLMRVRGANGMKTGYICNAGYNVAASVTRKGRTLIAVVLGAASGLERIAFTRDLMDKGFGKRSGRYTLKTLPRQGGNPPADHYCKRNKKPGAKGIMAQFDMQSGESRSPVLSYASRSNDRGPAIPGLRLGKGSKSEKSGGKVDASVKLANGKIDWRKVMDRTIGPRRIAYAPIPVDLHIPEDATPTAAAMAAGGTFSPVLPKEGIPLPTPNPLRILEIKLKSAAKAAAPGAVAQKDFVKAETDAPMAAPGSLFQKGTGIAVPAPKP
ncbi:D-alanyl-D-alanine carboxypeptidase family protein [uncultured Roseibium sp.]|uniref:D-alanyl-D-alanine carboxypeptidase family protein n=1 Tax=uncultured Roseibium sp. TaxID=1936171 RepID=UPI00374D858F